MNICEVEPPCMNGGTCEDLEYDFNCTCPQYVLGKRCEGMTITCFNRGACSRGVPARGVPGPREGAWSRGCLVRGVGVPGPRGPWSGGSAPGDAWSRGVPNGDPPPHYGYCCRWYASYWNAFL